MNAVMNEQDLTLEVVFMEEAISQDHEAELLARREVMAMNQTASGVELEAFAAFMELLSAADIDYLASAREYIATAAAAAASAKPETIAAVGWEEISQALAESQNLLVAVQGLLAETLADMGVEDHQHIRVYSDMEGFLRVMNEHPRGQEMEQVLNSPKNAGLCELYHAAVSGMSLAGSLVGAAASPMRILEKVKADTMGLREYVSL